MTRCSVLGCVNRRDKLKPYFRFPSKKDPFQCLKWVVFCQRDDVKKGFFKSPDYIRNHTVCSEHFALCCFTNRDRNRLVHDAVPTLFNINPQRVKLHPHHPMTGLDIDTPPNAAQYPVDKSVLEEMMLKQSRELKTFLQNTWRQNHCKLDTLAAVPHVHGDDRIPIHKHSLFPENTSASPIQIIITASTDDAATPKPLQHPQSHAETLATPATPAAKGHKQRKRSSKAEHGTVKRKRARRQMKLTEIDDFEIKEEPVEGGVSPYYVCCAQGCTSTNKTCMLYPFPANSQQAHTWLQKSSRQDLESFLRLNGAVPNNFLLCRRHFHDDQFLRRGGQDVLKVQAIPAFFPGVDAALRQTRRRRPGPRRATRPVNYSEESEVVALAEETPIVTDPAAVAREATCILRLDRLAPSCVTLEFCADHSLGLSAGRRCKDLLQSWESTSVGQYNDCAPKKRADLALVTTPLHDVSSKDIVRCSKPCDHKTCKFRSKPTASVTKTQFVQDCEAPTRPRPRRSPIKRRTHNQWHTPQVESESESDFERLTDSSESDGSGYQSFCLDCEPRTKMPGSDDGVLTPTPQAIISISDSLHSAPKVQGAIPISVPNAINPPPSATNHSTSIGKFSYKATKELDAQHKELVDHDRIVTEEEKRHMDDLDAELDRLKLEYRVLYDATAFRKRKLKDTVARETTADAVFSRLKPYLNDAAYEFLARQLTHIPYVTWCIESTRFPILMTMCGVRLYPVFSQLFKLPSVSTLHLYKGKARKDPTLYGSYMKDFVQKQYRSRHHPATRRHFGRKGTQKSVPVAEQIIHYLEKQL